MVRSKAVAAALAATAIACWASPEPPTVKEVKELVGQPPAGWELADGPKVYSADRLWEWIDGEATELEEYRLKYAVVGLYSRGGKTVEVGVFAASTPLDAFGAFSRSHGEDVQPAIFVNAGAWAGDQLHVWRGFTYLRIQPVGAQPADRAAVESIARALVKRIAPARQIPLLLRLLPQENLVPCSVVYYRANFMGYRELRNGVGARYRAGKQRVQLWLMEASGGRQARAALDKLAKVLGKQRELPTLGDEAFVGASDTYGLAVGMRKGRFVAAVVGASARSFAEALLRMLSVRIQIETAVEE